MKSMILFVMGICPYFLLAQDTIVLQPGTEGKDALIWSITPDNNYGDSPKFLCMSWSFGGIFGADRSLIQFDLSEIPEGREIISAKLNLFFKNLEPNETFHTGENASFLNLITESWDEQTVTWNNAPSTTEDFQVMLPQSVNPRQDYLNIDVTEALSNLYQFPDLYFGWELSLIEESPYRCLLFASGDIDEAHLRPSLEIIYSEQSALTANFNYEIHENAFVTFYNRSEGYSELIWFFGDGTSSVEENPEHQFENAGHYNVCLTAKNDSLEDTFCDTVFLCNSTKAFFVIGTDNLECSFLNQSENADVFMWDFGDGIQSQHSNPEHVFSDAGIYTVRLIASNDCSSDTLTMNVNIVFDNTNDFVTFSPNPSGGDISIKSKLSGAFKLEISDQKGNIIVKEEGNIAANESINYKLSAHDGIYYCRIWVNNRWYQEKILLINP